MYLADPNADSIIQAIGLQRIPSESLVLILLAEKSRRKIPGLIRELNKLQINFCGGVFPGVIHDDKHYDEGAVIVVLPALEKPFLISGLDTHKFVLPDFWRKTKRPPRKKYTAIILVDGWASRISLLLSEIFNQLGNSFRYFGGGAGSLSLRNKPCLFTPEGEFRNAALVIFIALESTLGVRHGWKRLAGPIVANNTRDHIISELNWAPALQVYLDSVESNCGKKITARGFPRVSMEYPFGIYKEGCEDVVRDPIAVNEKGELICVGEVPENTALYILHGEKESLLSAAGQAARDCLKRKRKEITCCLVADCVSRKLFLGNEFQKELEMVRNIIHPCIPHGILSIGEIASHGEAYLEFFNKTIVVGAFHG
jgi:hypothetical protein